MKKWVKYQRLKHHLWKNIAESVGMMWWRKAHNECNRLNRLKQIWYGNPNT